MRVNGTFSLSISLSLSPTQQQKKDVPGFDTITRFQSIVEIDE
jgi:hypothetical protein